MRSSTDIVSPPAPVSFFEAFIYWLKLGFISFGGPAGQIALMHEELVERRRWISERRFLHALNYTMMLPGPEAQQLATYIGWLMHGTRGGIMAGVLFILPSLFILMSLTWAYLAFGDRPEIAGILYGIKPAVVAIVAFAVYRIGSRAISNTVLLAISLLAFAAIFISGILYPALLTFPYIILTAALIGLVGGRVAPDKFKTGGRHGMSNKHYGPALIDDQTIRTAHTHFAWTRVIAYALIGVLLWAIAIGWLTAWQGWQGTLAQIAWFFTKAALLTFGGAYAVLPYVYQGAVEHYHWLTATQMIDGLALGETTPGPLIMIVTFVGFVAGWTHQILGENNAALSGIIAACVATFFTFLPSFIFILVGAPIVEATRHNIKLTAPLSAITAAVVGVILNLAVFFAWHVFWPQGWNGNFDWLGALMAMVIFVGLWRFKWGTIPVVLGSALFGLLLTLIRTV